MYVRIYNTYLNADHITHMKYSSRRSERYNKDIHEVEINLNSYDDHDQFSRELTFDDKDSAHRFMSAIFKKQSDLIIYKREY